MMLYQHMGSRVIGKYTNFEEDARGLKFEGELFLQIEDAKNCYALLKGGVPFGMSIGFRIPANGAEWDENSMTRTINAIDLLELSVVSFPMNPKARVQRVKQEAADMTVREVERALRDVVGFSKTEAKTGAAALKQALKLRDADEGEKQAGDELLVAQVKELAAQMNGTPKPSTQPAIVPLADQVKALAAEYARG